jgi:acyl carrier protein
LPALSVNWGTWDEMRVASAADRSQIAQFGLQPMPARQALDTLGGLLALDEPPQVAVAAVDWPVLKTAYGARRSRPFFAEVGDPPRTRPETVVSATVPELLERVTAAASAERSEIVLAYVQSQVVRVLGIDPTQVLDPAQGLFNLGMDSLMSVELKSRLERATGRTLPSTLTFNYPNINALASYLADEVLANAEPAGDGAGPMTGDELAELSEDGAAMVTGDELAEQSEDDLADLLAARLAGLR